METTELALFTRSESTSNLDLCVPQEIATPQVARPAAKPQTTIEDTLKAMFPEQAEERKITQTRKLLGEVSTSLSDEQVVNMISEFQFLVDTWMDEFEKDIFLGKTLKEILNEE